MVSSFNPIIKWSGSKRSQSKEIVEHFPKQINTYYEPFCGGCSVLKRLLYEVERGNIKVNKFVCSDINNDLISLWNIIKYDPIELYSHYKKLWEEMNLHSDNDDRSYRRDYFNKVRSRFNYNKDPKDFLFIMRTTTNGMPRYNKNGEFNNSFHITRNGIKPKSLYDIIMDWSILLNKYNVEFRCCSYEEIVTTKNDFIYMDPPYAKTSGMYYGAIEIDKLFSFLREHVCCDYLLSFDGISGCDDNTYNVPQDLYDKHLYIKSGNSSFKRTLGKSNDSIVYESLYIKGTTYREKELKESKYELW